MKSEEEKKIIATNRKAGHLYQFLEVYEAGIVLEGWEVKAIRAGRVNIRESFARIDKGEVLLYNMHISPYESEGSRRYNPTRKRKLLFHKREIKRILGKLSAGGLALIPLRLYFSKRNKVKVELALAKGKKLYDRREELKRRIVERETRRALKERSL